jgi:hypothetical protein
MIIPPWCRKLVTEIPMHMPRLIKPPPASWEKNLTGDARALAWKHCAGETPGKTKKQANAAHKNARTREWDIEKARIAGLKDEKDRTDKEKEALLKVDHPWAYKKLRVGNSCVTPMIPPPASWETHLSGDARTEAWVNAAGVEKDGKIKSIAAHTQAREKIRNDARIREIQGKAESDKTEKDHAVMKKEEDRKSKDITRTDAHRSKPENRAKNIAYNAAYHMKKRKRNMEKARVFIEKHGLEVGNKELSEEDAFDFVYKLFDDKDSPMGKDIFDALDGMTLREAFWDGKSDSAFYALSSRGMGDEGKSTAESIRFLVANKHAATTVLTHMDGKNYKYTDPAFKNLELIYCPIGFFKSYADCTAVEAALQLLFNFLEVGSKRLWLQSGVGRFHRPLRTYDMKFIEKIEKDGGDKKDKELLFFCGITILKNVEVLARITHTNGKDVVTSIKTGLGTICKVNQPLAGTPQCSALQKAALIATQQRLGPNFMDKYRKRKAGALADEVTTHEDDDEVQVCETDESDTDSGDECESEVFNECIQT